MSNRTILFSLFAAALFTIQTQAATTRFKGYDFESYLTTDTWGRFPEVWKHGAPYLQVTEGAEYSIVINNPLPVRVAVAVTVDGLNVINGKRSSPDKAEKWMIDANSSLTLRGWQTGQSSLRRFYFTDQSGSYADWKGKRDNKDYVKNLGVIGVAYFWNKAELEAALHPPVPFVYRDDDRRLTKRGYGSSMSDEVQSAPKASGSARPASPACEALKEKEEKAGTGMGHHETNNVVDVEFHYDAGMYKTSSVLSIYYEFAQPQPMPQPFSGDNGRPDFSPEMPE
jgi:hypothetical protein